MSTQAHQHTPADPIPFAIAQHRRAYAASQAATARLIELHELFDKEWAKAPTRSARP